MGENAQRLSRIKTGEHPMQAERIRIPPRKGRSWSAFTNVILANDLGLMPVFDNDSPQRVRESQKMDQRLLPERTIETIDTSSMRNLLRELHCLSAHAPEFATPSENLISVEDAWRSHSVRLIGQSRFPNPGMEFSACEQLDGCVVVKQVTVASWPPIPVPSIRLLVFGLLIPPTTPTD